MRVWEKGLGDQFGKHISLGDPIVFSSLGRDCRSGQ
ncbi:MAG: hypothetical protein ACJAQT_002408 [Akkermansiaceae bacterium]